MDTVYWRYHDVSGAEVITDRLEDIPASLRHSAVKFRTTPGQNVVHSAPHTQAQTWPQTWHVGAYAIDPASCGIGAGAAALMLLVLLKRGFMRRIALALLGAIVLGSLYLTYLRRSVGLPGTGIASPTQVVTDTQHAAAEIQTSLANEASAADRVLDDQ